MRPVAVAARRRCQQGSPDVRGTMGTDRGASPIRPNAKGLGLRRATALAVGHRSNMNLAPTYLQPEKEYRARPKTFHCRGVEILPGFFRRMDPSLQPHSKRTREAGRERGSWRYKQRRHSCQAPAPLLHLIPHSWLSAKRPARCFR